MMLLAAGDKLVVATHNPGKLKEIRALLAPYGIDAVSAGELGLAEPEETGTTFRANAEIKARAAVEASGLPALADDSGLEVAALDGAPGVYSADWGGPDKDFNGAMARVRTEVTETGLWSNDGPVANFNATLAEKSGSLDGAAALSHRARALALFLAACVEPDRA
jgi:XTP/dITP diphosphohydrolase